VTRYFHDPLRRVTATRDPAGRTITQQWCTCGALEKLIDANGHATTWDRDVQARVTREVRADGTTATVYTYETTTSRLTTVIDPKGQATTYTYTPDNRVQQQVFTNAQIATPSVSYTYETGMLARRRWSTDWDDDLRVSRPWWSWGRSGRECGWTIDERHDHLRV